MKGVNYRNDDERRDEYLWDPAAPAESEVAGIEQSLAGHRWKGELALPPAEPPKLPEPTVPPERRPMSRLAWLTAAAALLAVVVLWRSAARVEYSFELVRGSARLDGVELSGAAGTLRAGQRLALGDASSARLVVGGIGSVELGANSRMRVAEPDSAREGAEHVLELEEGRLTASIFAAPRVFQLGTPAGIAVDMGCVYTTTVDARGDTRLGVVSGFVSFESGRRRVLVPAGAGCRAWPGRGPGTPTWDRAPEAWRAAVDRVDATRDTWSAELEQALEIVLSTDDAADSLTLWHLLEHPLSELRARVFERLASLAPPPAGVTRAACLGGDAQALRLWRSDLGWSW